MDNIDMMNGMGTMTPDDVEQLNRRCQDRWQGIQDVGDLRTAPPGEPSDVVARNDAAKSDAADVLGASDKFTRRQ